MSSEMLIDALHAANSLFPDFPYELLGKVVFAIVMFLSASVVAVAAIMLALIIWQAGWKKIANAAYDPKEDNPPVGKLQVCGMALALSRFRFSRISAAYHEAENAIDDSTTHRTYLKRVFHPDQVESNSSDE